MVAYSFKKQFIKPIQAGLGILDPSPENSLITPKRQTIRAVGKRRHAREGENVQLYYGMRTKQCTSIGVARCSTVTPIRMRIPKDDAFVLVSLDGALEAEATDDFAKQDGFGCVEDMWLFWRREHANVAAFDGMLIQWEPIR